MTISEIDQLRFFLLGLSTGILFFSFVVIFIFGGDK